MDVPYHATRLGACAARTATPRAAQQPLRMCRARSYVQRKTYPVAIDQSARLHRTWTSRAGASGALEVRGPSKGKLQRQYTLGTLTPTAQCTPQPSTQCRARPACLPVAVAMSTGPLNLDLPRNLGAPLHSNDDARQKSGSQSSACPSAPNKQEFIHSHFKSPVEQCEAAFPLAPLAPCTPRTCPRRAPYAAVPQRPPRPCRPLPGPPHRCTSQLCHPSGATRSLRACRAHPSRCRLHRLPIPHGRWSSAAALLHAAPPPPRPPPQPRPAGLGPHRSSHRPQPAAPGSQLCSCCAPAQESCSELRACTW